MWLFAVRLLVVLRPDGENDDGGGGKESPDKEGGFAEAGRASGGFVGVLNQRGLLVLAREEGVVFGRLFLGLVVV